MSDYLTTPGAAMTRKEREFIREVSERADLAFPKVDVLTFVNIGIEYGASLHCLRAGSERAAIIGIDLNTEKLVGNPRALLWRRDSTRLQTLAEFDGPIHLVLVDGGHDYTTVLADATLWTSQIPIGGYVIFHDYHNLQTMEILRKGIARVGEAIDVWVSEVTQHSWRDLVAPDSLRVLERLS